MVPPSGRAALIAAFPGSDDAADNATVYGRSLASISLTRCLTRCLIRLSLRRDSPAFGIYFLSYEYSLRYMNPNDRKDEPSNFVVLASGGIAGVLRWVDSICYRTYR